MCPLFTTKGTWGSNQAVEHKTMYEQKQLCVSGRHKKTAGIQAMLWISNTRSLQSGMVKRLLTQSISCPFHNWKPLEMWRSPCLVTFKVSPPPPPSPTVSLEGTKQPLLSQKCQYQLKGFHRKFNAYFPIQKADPYLSPGILKGKTEESTDRDRHRRTHDRQHRKQICTTNIWEVC